MAKRHFFTSINLKLPALEPILALHPPLFEDLVKIVDQFESTQEIGC